MNPLAKTAKKIGDIIDKIYKQTDILEKEKGKHPERAPLYNFFIFFLKLLLFTIIFISLIFVAILRFFFLFTRFYPFSLIGQSIGFHYQNRFILKFRRLIEENLINKDKKRVFFSDECISDNYFYYLIGKLYYPGTQEEREKISST